MRVIATDVARVCPGVRWSRHTGELRKNGRTDRGAFAFETGFVCALGIWTLLDWGYPGMYWRYLANTIERFVLGGDAVCHYV